MIKISMKAKILRLKLYHKTKHDLKDYQRVDKLRKSKSSKLYLNANIMIRQMFHKMKYDSKCY